ncbi:unnamed protein product, partial [Durusdinium trenchii]
RRGRLLCLRGPRGVRRVFAHRWVGPEPAAARCRQRPRDLREFGHEAVGGDSWYHATRAVPDPGRERGQRARARSVIAQRAPKPRVRVLQPSGHLSGIRPGIPSEVDLTSVTRVSCGTWGRVRWS